MSNNRTGRAAAAALAAAAAATTGLAQAHAAPAAAAAARSAPVRVEICGQGAAVSRPASMILTCADDGELAEHLVWGRWSATGATATGLVAWRTGSGGWRTCAARFTLGAPVDEPRLGRVFTALTLHAIGATPAGFLRDPTFDESPAAPAPAAAANPAPSPARQSPAPRASPAASADPAQDPAAASADPAQDSPAASAASADPAQDPTAASDDPAQDPAAPSGALGYAAIEGYWIAAGGSSSTAASAAAIAGAESSYYPGIIQQGVDYCGPGGDRAGWGLWQITCGNSVPSYGTDFQLLDPWNSAEAAVGKYDEDAAAGYDGFDPWSTYTTGAYESYLQSVTPATGLADPGEYVQDGKTPPGTPSSPAAAPGSTYGPGMGTAPTGQPSAAGYDDTLFTTGARTGGGDLGPGGAIRAGSGRRAAPGPDPVDVVRQPLTKASRSALMTSACVVIIPCGKPA